MRPLIDAAIDEERRSVREKMRLQRQTIADQLGPPQSNGGFPRSRTMRFLVDRPGLAAAVLAGIAELFFGARHARAASAAVALSRIVRAATGNGTKRARTERQRP